MYILWTQCGVYVLIVFGNVFDALIFSPFIAFFSLSNFHLFLRCSTCVRGWVVSMHNWVHYKCFSIHIDMRVKLWAMGHTLLITSITTGVFVCLICFRKRLDNYNNKHSKREYKWSTWEGIQAEEPFPLPCTIVPPIEMHSCEWAAWTWMDAKSLSGTKSIRVTSIFCRFLITQLNNWSSNPSRVLCSVIRLEWNYHTRFTFFI